MKINKILPLLAIIAIIGCNRKTVQIPVLNVAGIQDTIYDNSQLWIFLEVNEGDTIAKLNRKNSIATTNWIYNIDKNLPMRLVIPHLQKLIEKREKPAMHPKDADDLNFFSYVDSNSNLLSMVKFDIIYFATDKVIDKNNFSKDTLKKHLFMDYRQNQLLINGSLISLSNLNNYFDNLSTEERITIHLSFDKKINYKAYLELKAHLQNVKHIELDTVEYIK